MRHTNIARVVRIAVLLAAVGLAPHPASSARAAENPHGPQLPAGCESIEVEAGHKLIFHTFARGVQIYKWNAAASAWVFDAPRASLFAEANFFGEVGSHYRGPFWESKSGSTVRGRRVPGTGCKPDASAIEWLKLDAPESGGPGIFNGVTFIQRTHTAGGLAPAEPGATDGQLKEVPYTAEYYFYRAEN
jgi:hypothetical protein